MHVRRPTAGPRQSQRAFGPPSRPSIGRRDFLDRRPETTRRRLRHTKDCRPGSRDTRPSVCVRLQDEHALLTVCDTVDC